MTIRSLTWISLVLLVSACSAHSPMILRNTVDTTPSPGTSLSYPPHSNRVWVSEGGLPANAKYQVLETIDVGTIWYGSNEKVDTRMADRARQIGADAVINVKHWRQPSGFSWASPHGHGEAVKIQNPNSVKLDTLPGDRF